MTPQPAVGGTADGVPALAALPGGNANVFTRAAGLPADPVDATGQVLQALAEGRYRRVGLGLAGDRYFTFHAGLGLDAEVVRAVDGHRARGRAATTVLYLRMILRQFYRVTDRRHPALMLERDGHPRPARCFSASCPTPRRGRTWAAVRSTPAGRPPSTRGLDLFALRSLGTVSTLRTASQLLSPARGPHGRSVLTLHDQAELTLRSARPVAFQLDGEYVGERESVRFLSVPDALRIVT